MRLERPKSILFQFNLRNPLFEDVFPNIRRPAGVLTVNRVGLAGWG
jgi:hypothetical protein